MATWRCSKVSARPYSPVTLWTATFIEKYTTGFEEFARALEQVSLEEIVTQVGSIARFD